MNTSTNINTSTTTSTSTGTNTNTTFIGGFRPFFPFIRRFMATEA